MAGENQGTDVVAEGDLIVELGSAQAGGEGGAAVLEDVSLSLEQETTLHHGVGNDEPIDHTTGNRVYSIDTEVQVSSSIYSAFVEMWNSDTASEAAITDGDSGTVSAEVGKLVPDSVEMQASDGEDVTMSLEATCYEVSL